MENLIQALRYKFKHSEAGFIVLLFMVFVYPFVIMPGSVPYRYFALVIVSLYAAVLLLNNGFRLDKAAWLPLTAFIFILIPATLFSDDILQAWIGSSIRLTGSSTYLFCAILFVLASQSKSRQRIINAMVIAAAIVSVIAIMQHYGINIVPHDPFRQGLHSYGTLGHPNFLGTYTVFILPAAMMLFLYQNRPLWLICSALIFAALMASLTRGAWLAFAAIILLFIYHVIKNPRLRKSMVILLIVFLALYLLFNVSSSNLLGDRAATIPVELESITEYKDDSSVSIRIYVWQETLKIIADNWIFGVGPDNLRIPVPQGYVEDKAFNIFLEITATMGIFSLMAYLALIYFSLKQNKGWFGTLLSLMIIAYFLQGQFNIEVLSNMPLFWIVIGLTWADGQERATIQDYKCNWCKK